MRNLVVVRDGLSDRRQRASPAADVLAFALDQDNGQYIATSDGTISYFNGRNRQVEVSLCRRARLRVLLKYWCLLSAVKRPHRITRLFLVSAF
jgi:hypothetical protein